MKNFTLTEWFYWGIWKLCGIADYPFKTLGNWAVGKINKSYYGIK